MIPGRTTLSSSLEGFLAATVESNGQRKSKATAIGVLLVDDSELQTLRSTLQEYDDIEVVGEATDGEKALLCLKQLQPAVIVIDINTPRIDGITATQLIKAQYPLIAVVGLSVEQKITISMRCRKQGALRSLRRRRLRLTYTGRYKGRGSPLTRSCKTRLLPRRLIKIQHGRRYGMSIRPGRSAGHARTSIFDLQDSSDDRF